MVRLALQRALDPAWGDELFERECGAQYKRELLFSTTMELIGRSSAFGPCWKLAVSVQALYDKLKHTVPIWYGHWRLAAPSAWAKYWRR